MVCGAPTSRSIARFLPTSPSTTSRGSRHWRPRPKKRSLLHSSAGVEGPRVSALETLLREAEAEARAAGDLQQLDAVRVKYLGKKGLLTDRLKELGRLPPEQRPAAGKKINEAKDAIAEALEARRRTPEAERLDAELAAERLDVTLPERGDLPGGLHPVTRTLRRMTRILARAGFDVATGPEIEDEYHNFTALNIPDNHPARAMHDTFYLKSGLLLRTHTSPVQIRAAQAHGVPLRVIAPGRVYRCDSDMTHTPMFTQVEGLAIDRGISFANLKSVLYEFVSNFFERDVRLR